MSDPTRILGVLACLLLGVGGCTDDGPPPVPAPFSTAPCVAIGDVVEVPIGFHQSKARLLRILAKLKADKRATVTPPMDEASPNAKNVVLLFGRASQQFYTVTLPILEAQKHRAVLAVAADLVGAKNMMTVAQLKDAQQRGVVLATGGLDGNSFKFLTDVQIALHTKEARDKLWAMGLPTDIMAYPLLRPDARVVAATKAAGFSVGIGAGHAPLAQGGYVGISKAQRFELECGAPVTATTDEALDAYLDSDRIEAENAYIVANDPPKLDRITQGDSANDSFGHIYMADEGDAVVIPLYFKAPGTFTATARVKVGLAADPLGTGLDYAYELDGQKVTYELGTAHEPENKNITWGSHALAQLVIKEAGWHELKITCLRDWSCLVDWLQVKPL